MGSQHHNTLPSAREYLSSESESSSSSSFESIHTNEYRSSRACDYKKTVTSRGSKVVHNELARGYNSADPHPPYLGTYVRDPSSCAHRDHETADEAAAEVPGVTRIDNNLGESVAPLPQPLFPSANLCKELSSFVYDAQQEHGPSRTPVQHAQLQLLVKEGHGILPKFQEPRETGILSSACAAPLPGPSTSSTTSKPSEEYSCVDIKHFRDSTRAIEGSPSKGFPSDLPEATAAIPSKDCESTTSSLSDESITAFLSEYHARASDDTNLLPTDSSIRQKCSTFTPAHSHDQKSKFGSAKRSASSESRSQTSSEAPSVALTTDSRRHRKYFNTPSPLVEALPSDRHSESSLSVGGDTGSIFTYASTVQTLSDIFEDIPRALMGECVLPCEFVGYTSCDQWFHPEHKDQWINHVMVDHLASNLPSKCSCWYCDDYDFDSNISGFDRTTNFVQRMEHIREHIVNDGYGVNEIRPDFSFIKHVTQLGLIQKPVYENACSWTEGPVSGVTGIYAHDWLPPERVHAHEASEWVVINQQKEDRRRNKETRRTARRPNKKTTVVQPRAIEAGQNNETLQSSRDIDICQDARSICGQEGQRVSTAHSPTSASNGLNSLRSPVLSDASEEPSASVQNSHTVPSIQGLQNLEERLSELTISSHSRDRDFPEAQKVGESTEGNDQSDTSFPVARSHGPLPSLASNIQLAVQRLVQSLNSEARTRFVTHQEHTNASSRNPCSIPASSRPESSTKQACPPPGRPRPGKKKRKLSNDQSESEGSDKEHIPAVTSKGKQKEDQLPFACPFFKHNRSKYGNRRYCNGPGWPDMHRLKEHLFRKHKQAVHCRRCWTPFKEQTALTAHQRDVSQCPVLSEVRIEGIDEFQERQLKSRKTFSKMEECAKWRKVYIIIFPEVTEDEIPTPYYDLQDVQDSLERDSLEEHKSRLRQELPSHIVNALVEGLKKIHLNIDTRQLQEHCIMAVDRAFDALSRDGDDVTRTSNSLGPMTGDLHQQLNEHAQPSTLESTSSLEILENSSDLMSSSWGTDYGPLIDGFLLETVANTFPTLDTSDSSMEFLEADADLHQNMGMGKPTSDSGYGSRADHDYHKWL